jgi:DNA mismatch repair ATPase MutS
LARATSNCFQGTLDWLCRVLLIDFHLAYEVDDWKKRHGESLRVWMEEWAEFEALNSLAGYAYEHPEDAMPELLEGTATFEATGMGHPMMEGAVRNDVGLGEHLRFYLVSGSNMAGKSTLLRAIGLNAVLANAGAPVRAERARMSLFSICASISTVDSPTEGKSKFLAEMGRIRGAIEEAQKDGPTLFLIDEILSGTNSRDRRIAAEHVVGELVRRGAVGALSTHDLALTEIAERPELRGENVHMSSRENGGPLDFDYVLKAGVFRGSNALEIARMAGVEIPG